MSPIKSAMVLAAGRGERMRPLTDVRPKPLAEVAGKSLIQYHIERLVKSGVENIVINTAWLGAQIPAALGDGARFGATIRYSDEGTEALETGGGIVKALPLLGRDPFWVVSADLWTDFPFAHTAQHLDSNDLAHLIMVDNPDFHPRGDFYLANNRVTDTVMGERLTYASIAIFRPELFAGRNVGKFSFVPLLRTAMSNDRVSGEKYLGSWHNIGTIAQLAELNSLLSAKK